MAIGDSITPPIPPVGTTGTGYASQLVAFLQEVKARLEAKVALTSLVAGLFDMNNNGIANIKYAALYEQLTVPSTPVGSLQRYGGELYYVSPSGAVRITNAGTLDAVSLRGITGGYAAPAEFRYDVPSLEYYAYSDFTASPKLWARVAAQGYDVYGTVNGTTRARIGWAGGANPSYTLMLPATVPGSTSVVQMDSSGTLTASNTIVNSVTMAVNKDITLSGTGRIKHDELSQSYFNFQLFSCVAASGVTQTAGVPGAIQAASTVAYYPLPVFTGNGLLTFCRAEATANIPATVTMELVSLNAAGTFATFGLTGTGTGASSQVDITSAGLAATNGPLWLKVTTGVAGITLTRGFIKYKQT